MPNGEPEERNTPWTWIGTTFTTAVFLVIWGVAEYGIHWIFKKLPLEGLDIWVELCIEIGFGLAILVTIGLWCYREFGIMYYRARRDVRAARWEFENQEGEDEA